MLPPDFFTVATPSWTSHWAGDWSLTVTHSSRFLPSKRTMASEGGVPRGSPGVTTGGLGVQISVSSGLGLGWSEAGCWAWTAITADDRKAKASSVEKCGCVIDGKFTPPGLEECGAKVRGIPP